MRTIGIPIQCSYGICFRMLLRGAPPLAPTRVSPGFRASLVQPSASLRPFHSRFASFQGWEIPLPLRLLPPAFARRRSACMYTPPPDLRAKAVQQSRIWVTENDR